MRMWDMTSARLRTCGAGILCCLMVACATTREAGTKTHEESPANTQPANPKETQPKVTFQTDEDYIGDIIHSIGQQVGGSMVLANGAELRFAGPENFRQANYAAVAKKLATSAKCAVQECDGYLFLYPEDLPNYDTLINVSLVGKLDPTYSSITTAMTFGYGTRIHAAFAVLSHVLGITIVADNAVADVKCGEVTLGEVPLDAALEAILKSARIVTFNLDSTPEYIFLSSPQNKNPRELLINPDALDEHQKAVLNKKVSVYLPEPQNDQGHFVAALGASHLVDVLPTLSQQLRVPVVAERELEQFPVNPVVLNNVRMRTALDLIVRQWLRPEFGYQVLSDKILLRRKDPEKK